MKIGKNPQEENGQTGPPTHVGSHVYITVNRKKRASSVSRDGRRNLLGTNRAGFGSVDWTKPAHVVNSGEVRASTLAVPRIRRSRETRDGRPADRSGGKHKQYGRTERAREPVTHGGGGGGRRRRRIGGAPPSRYLPCRTGTSLGSRSTACTR